jgi:antitoxin component YwqK of YwqJK toxin-antitoxin module
MKTSRYVTAFMICITFACNNKPSSTVKIELFNKTYPPLNYNIKGALINGKKEGLWITSDSSGVIETEQTYLHGKSVGAMNVYSEGYLVETIRDKINGSDTVSSYRKINVQGKVLIEGTYINGRKRGTWLFYSENGKHILKKLTYVK